MADIQAQSFNIAKAFRDCNYIIPNYQREYVWTYKEVRQLLEDIDEQITEGASRQYFIGTVLVSSIEGEEKQFAVIDGQQRLTTLYLLLCALKCRLKGEAATQNLRELILNSYFDLQGNPVTSLKLDPQYENAHALMAKLVDVDSDPTVLRASVQAAGITSFGSLENLLNAYETIYSYLLDNYENMDELKKYLGYICSRVIFIQITTEVSSALKIFETINERGVGLNSMDLLKNLLFTQVPQAQFNDLRDEWKKITKPLEKEKEKPLRFLRYFLMANYVIKNERNDSIVREDEIYDWFTNKNNAAMADYANKPFVFVQKVVKNVQQYLAFAEGKGNDGKNSLAMENLRHLTGAAFSLHYVLLMAGANLPKELFNHFVRQLESFLFYYIFTKTPTKELERNFSVWADEIREIAAIADEDKQKAALNAFVKARFESNMDSKAPELADSLRRLTLNSMQRYRTRYLLMRLTQHVDMGLKGITVPGSLEQYLPLEIEHILPNNPDDELRAEWDTKNPGSQYDEYKNRLGNLTLLEKPINIVAGNDFYGQKQIEYTNCGNYLTRSLSGLANVGKNTTVSRINEHLLDFPTWDAKAIEDRHGMLIKLVSKIWKTSEI